MRLKKDEVEAIVSSIRNLQTRLHETPSIKKAVIRAHDITAEQFKTMLELAELSWGDNPEKAKQVARLQYIAMLAIEKEQFNPAIKALEIVGNYLDSAAPAESDMTEEDKAYYESLKQIYKKPDLT